MMGDAGVGKTSLVLRFAYNVATTPYIPSAGLIVSSKTVVVARNGVPTAVTLLLWDPASPAHYDPVGAGFLNDAAVVVLVCDVTSWMTAECLPYYVEQAALLAPSASLAFVVNKIDLESGDAYVVRDAHALALALDAPIFHTSTRTNQNVQNVLRAVAVLALGNARCREVEESST